MSCDSSILKSISERRIGCGVPDLGSGIGAQIVIGCLLLMHFVPAFHSFEVLRLH